jgi:hypothetical protein
MRPFLPVWSLVVIGGGGCLLGAIEPLKADINFGNDPSSLAATGNFVFDNDEQYFTFFLDQLSTLTVQTTSYASNQNGFAPNLTLFNTTTSAFIAQDDGGTAPGGCGTRGIGADGFCFDAVINQTLAPGNYTLVLTEQGNQALGGLTDGFFFDAVNNPCPTNNFTNSDCLGYGPSPGAFYLFDGTEQTSYWALSGETVAAVSPEPSYFFPSFGLAAVLSAIVIARRLRGA